MVARQGICAEEHHRVRRVAGRRGRQRVVFAGGKKEAGTTVSADVREETGGQILQSTFTSIPDIGAELYPWLPVRWISTIKYDTRARLPQIRVPVLIMHSRADDLIAFHHAEANFAAANEPKFFCELEGAHNDGAWNSPAFGRAVDQFLHRVEQESAEP